jgi:LAS superfamily LD-carboxypeptidase LdcB
VNNYLLFFLFFLFISCHETIRENHSVQIVKQDDKVTGIINKEPHLLQQDSVPKNTEKQLFIDKNVVLGRYNYKKHKDFVKVEQKYCTKTSYLNKKVYQSFIKMYNDAKKEAIILKIVSGTRSYYHQKLIWERKWKLYNKLTPVNRVKKILEYSSMPSTSRHHWGTDIDLNNLNNRYFTKGKGKKIYDWLIKNANKYGFYQVYSSKDNGRKGYNMEKWHWSYLPIAGAYLDYYNQNVTYKDIKGFNGSKFAKDVKMIENYVNGISKKALNYRKNNIDE